LGELRAFASSRGSLKFLSRSLRKAEKISCLIASSSCEACDACIVTASSRFVIQSLNQLFATPSIIDPKKEIFFSSALIVTGRDLISCSILVQTMVGVDDVSRIWLKLVPAIDESHSERLRLASVIIERRFLFSLSQFTFSSYKA
ncbi:hypothetical protein SeMB42_g06706, partial [Synchytrium endobioticum]